MKAIYSFLFALIFLASNSVQGQSYLFKVLANKGENQVKTTAEESWKPLKTGSTLNSGDEVKVTNNAYLGLVHTSGKTVELKKAEVIDINELASSLNTNQSSVASKYADFVLNKMTQSGDKQDRLAATGAVTRATDNASLKVFMPSSVEVLNPEPIIEWTKLEDAQQPTYVVTLKNMFDEVILSKETNKNQIALDLASENLADERLVILNVSVKDDEDIQSGDYGIQRLTGEKSGEIKSEVEKITENNDMESSLTHIMLAGFYEDKNLLVDAGTSYQKAIALSPDVEDFEVMYYDFVERNNLDK